MPSRRLILVAHASTDATRRGVFPRADEPPEAAGLAAATALADYLPSFARALVSPAAAATATAAALGLETTVDLALRDLDVGTWSDRDPSDLPAEALAAWMSDPGWCGHGGESLAAFRERVARFLESRLADRGPCLAMTHSAVVRAALAAALDAPHAGFWRIDAAPLHAVVLSGDGRRWTLRACGPLASAVMASGG